MSKLTYKYEFTPDVVQYLLSAVNSVQFRGSESAKNLLIVESTLRSPLNIEEIKKAEENTKKEEGEKAIEEIKKTKGDQK